MGKTNHVPAAIIKSVEETPAPTPEPESRPGPAPAPTPAPADNDDTTTIKTMDRVELTLHQKQSIHFPVNVKWGQVRVLEADPVTQRSQLLRYAKTEAHIGLHSDHTLQLAYTYLYYLTANFTLNVEKLMKRSLGHKTYDILTPEMLHAYNAATLFFHSLSVEDREELATYGVTTHTEYIRDRMMELEQTPVNPERVKRDLEPITQELQAMHQAIKIMDSMTLEQRREYILSGRIRFE